MFRAVVRDAADAGYRMPIADAIDGMAAISVSSRTEDAATLLGMADRIRAELRLTVWHEAAHRCTVASVRESLGDDRFAFLHASGHAMTLSAMVEMVELAAPAG